MIMPLAFQPEDGETLNVLCIGAHSDDIEIGCGGTILRLAEDYSIDVTWVVLGASGRRRQEAQGSVSDFLKSASNTSVKITEFRNSYFPYDGKEIKEYIETVKSTCNPDIIFSHHGEDLHQDHRFVAELTWNSFRDHLILEYEIPKYDGGIGSPNFFVPLSEETYQRKIDLIMKYFESQKSRSWFTPDTFKAMLRIRGIECNSPSGYAEAYYSRKIVV